MAGGVLKLLKGHGDGLHGELVLHQCVLLRLVEAPTEDERIGDAHHVSTQRQVSIFLHLFAESC
jgi:hypothetical protein